MKRRFKPRPRRTCWFTDNKCEPDYKQPDILMRFISDRGKILTRRITGTCAKHQRSLAREIKRARHLGLLPFVTENIK